MTSSDAFIDLVILLSIIALQSKEQNLTGRKSWSFLASCMTS
jgi:hypothetical protein